MEFWLWLYFLSVVIFVWQWIFPKMNFSKYLMIFTGLLSGFRYELGDDYFRYEKLFNITTLNYDNLKLEILFQFLCNFFRDIGFNAQSIFLFYAVITNIFIYLGVKGQFDKNLYRCMSCVLFIIVGFYFRSMDIIRQMAAVSIVFYNLNFLIKKEYFKYYLGVILGTFFHYSAIIAFIFPVIMKIKSKQIMYTAVLLAVVFHLMNIPLLLIPFLSDVSYYSKWVRESAILENGTGIGMITEFLIYSFIIYKSNYKTCQEVVMVNSLCGYLIIKNFFYIIPPLLRIGIYFHILIVLMIPLLYDQYKSIANKCIIFILIAAYFVFISMKNIYTLGYGEKINSFMADNCDNIEYNYRLDILN
ncbi:EpsG family protein [Phascolarctobacterium faecium]|jgi:hypothetical protein|uniref:EpsG family protein n=1 Tax=Phascolarctobacterium faecium TaxID=33025 RepID=UPI0026669320|nr:EpsG family protein [Phascolarctobacterium faecium]